MLVADNEFGAPWNDQYYQVRYITIDDPIPNIDIMTLSGPKNYDIEELYEKAKNMLPTAIILDIKCDS